MKRELLPKFFLANDATTKDEFLKNMGLIEGVYRGYGVKINLDLIMKEKDLPGYVKKHFHVPVFADLKMWNGKRTMKEIVTMLGDQGVAMINVWAVADNMIDAVVEEAKKYGIVVLGVTVLTHYTEDYCLKVYKRTMGEAVALFAQMSLDHGCDGYILPGTCLENAADLGGIKFNPATRPVWFVDKKANFQEQIMEPGEALRRGADIVSCGTPVFGSPDPKEALLKIIQEVDSATPLPKIEKAGGSFARKRVEAFLDDREAGERIISDIGRIHNGEREDREFMERFLSGMNP